MAYVVVDGSDAVKKSIAFGRAADPIVPQPPQRRRRRAKKEEEGPSRKPQSGATNRERRRRPGGVVEVADGRWRTVNSTHADENAKEWNGLDGRSFVRVAGADGVRTGSIRHFVSAYMAVYTMMHPRPKLSLSSDGPRQYAFLKP
ncbi:hypothetical protein B296_00038363 [Ensete ventricosum]|uniref:Uncharacterized protein n=1 Tax=Ensete ventricosum TaxID=4639 RepID=A0A426ZI20_ENSVE|nr:hypothetical protein B296_00038363 [Ensete ventricosum]